MNATVQASVEYIL